jgi:chitinase
VGTGLSPITLEDSDAALLPQFVQAAHQNVRPILCSLRPYLTLPQNVEAVLAIGGWGGSIGFSAAVADDANRTAFAQSVMSLVQQYELDGIDFEYVHPNLFYPLLDL